MANVQLRPQSVLELTKPSCESPKNNPTKISDTVKITREIQLPAKSFTESWEEDLRDILNSLTGTLYNGGELLEIDSKNATFSSGLCTLRGTAIFQSTFSAEIYSPKVDDVIDVKVYNINHYGLQCVCGPGQVFVPKDYLNDFYVHDRSLNSYVTTDAENKLSIHIGSEIRVKIFAIRADQERILMIGTTQEDYLGLLTID